MSADSKPANGAGGDGTSLTIVVQLRGEVFLEYAEFDRINAEREAAGEDPFSHPRNSAAGTLKST